jgi:selenide,water dikinase
VLRRLPAVRDKNLLVGANTADDAGVYRLDRDRALVQTVDFFTPIVDDPFAYGQIAAANALSDVYAMGGRPLTAMNLMGVPIALVPPETIAKILRGGAAKVKEAGCALVGGHTIRNPEPVYGLSVTGLVNPRRLMTNAAARPGDLLVLTKPLGTGIATTGIKRGLTSKSLERKAIAIMQRLNAVGADLAEAGLVKAATDLTGFGLMGHLASTCRASGVGAVTDASAVPAISPEVWSLINQGCIPSGSKDNRTAADEIADWGNTTEPQRVLVTDAQTSGGLLLCVRPKNLDAVLRVLNSRRTPAASIVGEIVKTKRPLIRCHS